MTKAKTLSVNLPFDGFYGSNYSDALDYEESFDIENNFPEKEREEHPAELRVSSDDYAQIVFMRANYSLAHLKLARQYVDAFNHFSKSVLGLSLDLTFEQLTSPREYNFETDRIFAQIPITAIRQLFAMSKANNHAILAEVISDRHSSRSGFVSFYSSNLADWLSDPVTAWDENQLCTLIIACFQIKGFSDSKLQQFIFDDYFDGETISQAWESCIDWAKVESDLESRRYELQCELDPALPLPVYVHPDQLPLPFPQYSA